MQNSFNKLSTFEILNKSRIPNFLFATISLILPLIVNPHSTDRTLAVEPKFEAPKKSLNYDPNKYAPIFYDIPQGVVKFQTSEQYTITQKDVDEDMVEVEGIEKRLGETSINNNMLNGHGLVIKDSLSRCSMLATAEHINVEFDRHDYPDKTFNYFTQIHDYRATKGNVDVNKIINNYGGFVNVIANEKTDFSLSVFPIDKANECTALFYSKYTGNTPKPGDIIVEHTTFNPAFISNKTFKKPYMDLNANLSTENPYGSIVRKIPMTVLASQIGDVKNVMGLKGVDQIPNSVILAITPNLKTNGNSFKNVEEGASGSPFFDNNGKFIGSHHGSVKKYKISDTPNKPLKNLELIRLQLNCRKPNPVLDLKACEVIKKINPSDSQLVMIANPNVGKPNELK